jgi:hypothetical protein
MMRGRIIVLEGPDTGGKSTAARHLLYEAQKLGLKTRYVHQIKRRNVWAYHYRLLHLLDRWSRAGDFIVVDRWWPSESAYGRTYRGGSKMKFAARGLDRVALHLGVTYVKCLPPLEVCVDAHRELRPHRGDELDGVRRVWGFYKDWGSGLLPSDSLDYLDHCASRNGARSDILDYDRTKSEALEELTWRVFHDCPAAPLVGTPHFCHPWVSNESRALVLGEVVNPKKVARSGQGWPFVDNDHCSEYLHEALTIAGLYEADFSWLNAQDPGSDAALKKLHEIEPSTAILALGGIAHTEARGRGFNHVRKLPHPSWARRWGQMPVKEYAQLLLEAVR